MSRKNTVELTAARYAELQKRNKAARLSDGIADPEKAYAEAQRMLKPPKPRKSKPEQSTARFQGVFTVDSQWTPEREAALRENYPIKGKQWCVLNLGLTEPQVRSKAARLGLKARGISEAWHKKQADHAKKLTGRKRPDQSIVMSQLHISGKLQKTPEYKANISKAMKKWMANNEHPRGALGMRHNAETKSVIREKLRAQWTSLTDDQIADRSLKMIKTKTARGNLVMPRPHATWKAGWRTIGGKRAYFRSSWEANYARVLEWLKSHGNIIEWEHEPETFWFNGIKRGCVSYLPDFRVTNENQKHEYHEVKGWMDDRSKTKISRMKKYHPDVKLVVIDSKLYAKLKSQMSFLIEGWE